MKGYNHAVLVLFARILLLLSLLTTPLGMTAAHAAAPSKHDGHLAQMPMPNCPDNKPGSDSAKGIAACTMACSAALPAVASGGGESVLVICLPTLSRVSNPLHGLAPHPSTPPPKRS